MKKEELTAGQKAARTRALNKALGKPTKGRVAKFNRRKAFNITVDFPCNIKVVPQEGVTTLFVERGAVLK